MVVPLLLLAIAKFSARPRCSVEPVPSRSAADVGLGTGFAVVGMGTHAFGFRFWHVSASLADLADAEDRGFIQMPLSKPPK